MTKKLTINPNIEQVMKERYYQPNETIPQEMIWRVSKFVAYGEKQYGWTDAECEELSNQYFDSMNNRKWLPSSPFLMNSGTKVPMQSACFVVGGVNDDLNDIYEAVRRQGMINKMGGGTGFNFSKLRGEGAEIKSTGGTSSGVMSFMELFNTNGDIIKQGGRRRSANIGVLDYTHPEILKYIDYKTDHSKLNNFNLSILVDDAFMHKVLNNQEYDLVSPTDDKVVKRVNARDVFMKIVENNWKSGEPGLLFRDAINNSNPMRLQLGDIVTTNPCGEVTLYDDEACNLASINLEEFVDWDGNVNWEELKRIVRMAIRFLDTAIDVGIYPDEKIEKKVKELRRLGLGVMSLHGALIKAGYKYSSPEGRAFAEKLMQFISEKSWEQSELLAEEKGKFPLFHLSDFDRVYRNVATTCIAPTGTIQMILDTSSSGVEPIFSFAYVRRMSGKDGVTTESRWVNPIFKEYAMQYNFWSESLIEQISDNGGRVRGVSSIPHKHQEILETAMEIVPFDHVHMQSVLQKHVSNSISKTINAPQEATVSDVYDTFVLGWKLGLKGLCYYRDGSRTGQVLSTTTEQAPEQDANILQRGEVKEAPQVSTESRTVRLKTGCGTMYLTMTKDEDGSIDQTFVSRGSTGTCLSNQTAVSRLISLNLRTGGSVEDVIDQLQSVPVCPAYYGKRCRGGDVSPGTSCPSAIAIELAKYAKQIEAPKIETPNVPAKKAEKKKPKDKNTCPQCGEKLRMEEGCMNCVCGYSKCG